MEPTSQDNIVPLIIKFLKGELDAEEQRQLDEWMMAKGDRREMLLRLQDPVHVHKMLDLLKEVDVEKNWGKFWPTIAGEEAPLPLAIKPVRQLYRWALTAVAACLILMIPLTYFWRSRPTPARSIEKGLLPLAIGPGRNTAILTLDSGRKIYLDSIGDGSVAQHGDWAIVKQGGMLLYKKSSDAAATTAGPLIYNTLTTPRSGQFELRLPDGSRVWLNNSSSLRFPISFTGNIRPVYLTGEAYFDIAKDDLHPFQVTTGDLTVKVLGTGFNLMAYPDEEAVKTTLVEGKIRVEQKDRHVVLRPGEQVAATPAGDWKIIPSVNTEEITDWKNGLFHFDNSDLHAVMRQLARWYDVQVEFRDEFPNRHIQGAMHRDLSLNQVLELLTDKDIHFTVKDRTVIVSH